MFSTFLGLNFDPLYLIIAAAYAVIFTAYLTMAVTH